MSQKVLIAYATRAGSTAEVANEIADVLTAGGLAVDVIPVGKVEDLAAYRAVVVGSAIRAGKWQPEAVKFVARHKDVLDKMPTAYFTVCLTAKDKTDEACQKLSSYLEPVRALRRPDVEGFFAGRMDYGRLGFIARTIIKKMKIAEGDFLDHAAIKAWAEEAITKLKL
jgi:menaquinone-dependent protoporphyrinogen oxidase